MKRRDLLKRIAESAKARGLHMEITEGGNHTKIRLGDTSSVVPRHNEIGERLAAAILKQLGVE